jgi:hypothetical protein
MPASVTPYSRPLNRETSPLPGEARARREGACRPIQAAEITPMTVERFKIDTFSWDQRTASWGRMH